MLQMRQRMEQLKCVVPYAVFFSYRLVSPPTETFTSKRSYQNKFVLLKWFTSHKMRVLLSHLTVNETLPYKYFSPTPWTKSRKHSGQPRYNPEGTPSRLYISAVNFSQLRYLFSRLPSNIKKCSFTFAAKELIV